MRTKRFSLAFSSLLLALTGTAFGSIDGIYDEDFAVDPGFAVSGGYLPGVEECFCYCYSPLPGEYRVRLSETTDHADKWVTSQPFDMVGGSFLVSVDVNVVSSSTGMPIGMQFIHSSTEETGISISFAGDHDRVLRFSDNNGHLHTVAVDYRTWYHVTAAYDEFDGEIDIRVYDRETGSIVGSLDDMPFDPGQFDLVRLGWVTGVGDGASAEMLFDNIKVYALPENPVYAEPFDWNPGYGFCTGYSPLESETFEFDDDAGIYRVRIDETLDHTDKYGCSATFETVDPALYYRISVDMNFWESSFGMPIGMKFGTDGDVTDKLAISYSGTQDGLIRVSDGLGNLYTTSVDLQKWYRVEIEAVTAAGLVDIGVYDRDTGDVVAEWFAVPFSPVAFNQLMVGWGTGVGDGTVAEVLVDNVCVETLPFVPALVEEPSGADLSGPISSLRVHPNPGRQPIIGFSLSRPVEGAALEVFDVNGRVVAGTKMSGLASGTHQIQLGDMDPKFRDLPSGRYFVTFRARGVPELKVPVILIH
ncbi:MAG: T9SS type A sorting domain-containing protein [Candidatus Eisenbacteria bacterium]